MTIPLKHNHPTLFMSILIKAAFLTVVGALLFIFGGKYFIEPQALGSTLIPINYWGLPLIAAGVAMFYGATSKGEHDWVRKGLFTASIVAGVFSAAYLFAFLGGYSDRILGIVYWAYISGTMAVWIQEPVFNPISSVLLGGKAGK